MPSRALAPAGKARLRLRDHYHWGMKSSRVGACRMTEFLARRH
jgi:hypothetical protein